MCNSGLILVFKAVSWLRRLVAGLSPRRPVLDPGPVSLRFVMGRVALGQVLLPAAQFSPVIVGPPVLHTCLHLHVALTRRTNGRKLGIFQKAAALICVVTRTVWRQIFEPR
jgi:hypothetical protein